VTEVDAEKRDRKRQLSLPSPTPFPRRLGLSAQGKSSCCYEFSGLLSLRHTPGQFAVGAGAVSILRPVGKR
jgi:hypothetical protein